MATISKRVCKNGEETFRCTIRKKNIEISKTLYTEEDAKLYAFYKERLVKNMDAFEVDIKDRVTLSNIYDLRLKYADEWAQRDINELNNSFERVSEHIPVDEFICKISFETWVEAAKKIYSTPVYRGAQNECNKRVMSPKTLRRIFATLSSAFSFAISRGIAVENLPLKVLQSYVNPLIKECET